MVHGILFTRGFDVFTGEHHKDHTVFLSLLNRLAMFALFMLPLNEDLQDANCQPLIYIEVFLHE